jgi:hypothetical protein
MKCVAVKSNSDTTQINYNFLSGTATVVDYYEGTAFEYNSWNFKAHFTTPAKKGQLLLGTEYDSCPRFVKFTYVKPYANLGLGWPALEEGYDRVAIASCTQDFTQERKLKFTKLSFNIWDADEQPLSGPNYDCTDSWRYVPLAHIDHSNGNFGAWPWGNLKTDTAVVRVYGVGAKKKTAPDDCWKWAATPPWADPSEGNILPDNAKVTPAGLVGVVVRPLYIPEDDLTTADPVNLRDGEAVKAITAAEMNTSPDQMPNVDVINYCATDICK